VVSFDLFWLPRSPHHWTISLATHSPTIFTNILEILINVWKVKQAVGLHCL